MGYLVVFCVHDAACGYPRAVLSLEQGVMMLLI